MDTANVDSRGNLTITASSPFDIDPIIEDLAVVITLAAYGNPGRFDQGSQFITEDLQIRGYEGWDRIAGGAINDYLDDDEIALIKMEETLMQTVRWCKIGFTTLDATSGINANFETGSVTDDGFGGADTVLNFEKVYGSFHDDIVRLSHDIYRGYMPMYGNDTITGPATQEIVNNTYLGYWNLVDADTEHKSEVNPNVTEAHIVFNFDAGTVDKYITGGVYDIKPVDEADYQDTFSGAIEGVVGSRGSDIIYGHSTDGKSTIIDGDRSHYFGWLNAYHGDDAIVALGSGDDKLQGGGGDDILIIAGSGEYDIAFGHVY